jgi:signal transduction histidine kinase
VEVAVYRVVAEALANVARHSGTTRATVRVSAQPGAVRAEIVDDGHGGAEPRDGGVGLGSMRERAEELGGTLAVDSRAGAGTHVHLHLPVEAARPVPDATTVTP